MSRRWLVLALAAVLWACQEVQAPIDYEPTDEDPLALPSPWTTEQFRGRYVIRFAEDLEQGTVVTSDMVELDDGGMLELNFRGRRPDIQPGARIRVRGRRQGSSVAVEDGGVQAEGPGQADADVLDNIAMSAVTKRVAVVLFNFSNNTAEPYTTAHAAGIVFTNANSVAAYYQSNSWDKVTLVGNVFGWFTIPETNAGCTYSAWGSSAAKVAAAAGIDLSSASYDHVVYAFPSTSGCGWSGMGNMPGRLSYINGSGMSLRTVAHELGHNFGTHHASTYSCTEAGARVSLSATTSNCTSSEYGDPFSIMGASTRRHTGPSLTNFAWLPAANRQDVTEGGDYRLAPLLAPEGVQSIRVQRTPSSFLTLEFRQPAGQFDAFSTNDPAVNGVMLRLATSTRSQSQLLDATPATNGFADAPLAVGRTFFDPLTGVSVTTLGISAAGADVRISFAPDGSPPSQPGDLKASALDSNRIELTWSASTDNIGVSGYRVLRGGALVATVSGTTYVDTGLAPATSYTYQVLAFDAAGNTSSPVSASASTPMVDTTPPSAPTNLTATLAKGRKVTLTWNASTDNVGIAGYGVFRNGTLAATVSGTSYSGSLPGGKNASATYYVMAYDAAGNISDPSNAVVVK